VEDPRAESAVSMSFGMIHGRLGRNIKPKKIYVTPSILYCPTLKLTGPAPKELAMPNDTTSPVPVERLVGRISWRKDKRRPLQHTDSYSCFTRGYYLGYVAMSQNKWYFVSLAYDKAYNSLWEKCPFKTKEAAMASCEKYIKSLCPPNGKDQWPGRAPGHETSVVTRSTVSPLLGKE
jgi:hypothetical protein